MNYGGYANTGGDYDDLFRGALGWASGGIPSPVIPSFSHLWGDNGRYNVDIQAIDDDMGFVWNFATNEPDPVSGYTQLVSHNFRPVEVENVNPTINGIDVSVDASGLCVRITGNSGNELRLESSYGSGWTTLLVAFHDGPNQVYCGSGTLSLIGLQLRLHYIPEDDAGANPSWFVVSDFPGQRTQKEKMVTFPWQSGDGEQTQSLSLGDVLLGVPLTFRVDASDPGSDNEAVIWDWGDSTPFGIQVHEVTDPTVLCGGANEALDTNFDGIPTVFDGCSDGVFERAVNSDRTPTVEPVTLSDVQTHEFSQAYLYYVMVLVVDDDNTEGYPTTYLNDGYDMDFVLLDLR